MDDESIGQLVDALTSKVKSGKTLPEARAELARVKWYPAAAIDLAVERYVERLTAIRHLKRPRVIIDERHFEWYPGPSADDVFWPPMSRQSLARLGPDDHKLVDDASTRIVSLLAPPSGNHASTRGLVLGHVQSGKTGNFTAVMAKAADAGYRMFIVLAGMHNNLRRQTQERVERDLVAHARERWHLFTEAHEDFKFRGSRPLDSYLYANDHQRYLCVVKKNTAPLKQLKRWLSKAQSSLLAECPVLIVDDEADQASIDTSPAGTAKRSAINRLILELLGKLPHSAYVGYTATPFANVLIDTTNTNDLYPRDFIVDLPRPKAYFGAERLFGRTALNADDEPDDGLDVIREVPQTEADKVKPSSRADRESFEPEPVPTLVDALHWFVIACATRFARGDSGRHMTMLVHTTLYTDSHRELGDLLGTLLNELRALSAAERSQRLKALWKTETERMPAEVVEETAISWSEIEKCLDEVLGADPSAPGNRIRVVVDNNKSSFRLDYPEDRGTIQLVVGGNTLSRGLTLDGLMVSYFVRTTYLYDTLLQMGRWFGYRKGYADLTRIWMTAELRDHFRHLALVEAEIRTDIKRYARYGATPADFGPRIRCHSTLAVTSPLKMRAAVAAERSFSGQVKQTFLLERSDADLLARNRNAVQALLREAGIGRPPEPVWKTHTLFRQVPVQAVREFLDDYEIVPQHRDLSSNLLPAYIDQQVASGQLWHWNVAVIGSARSTNTIDLNGLNLPLLQRAPLADSSSNLANLKAVLSTADLSVDFGWDSSTPPKEADIDKADALALRRWRDKERVGRNQPPHPLPHAPGVGLPLLLIYPIDKDSEPRSILSRGANGQPARASMGAADHLFAIALVFPDSPSATPVGYIVSNAEIAALDADAEQPLPDEEDEG